MELIAESPASTPHPSVVPVQKSAPVMHFSVDVDPKSNSVSMTGPHLGTNGNIDAPFGFSILVFELTEEARSIGATLLSQPITWIASGCAVRTPEAFVIVRDGIHRLVIYDRNERDATQSFPFILSVFCDERIMSTPDPTILNKPPG